MPVAKAFKGPNIAPIRHILYSFCILVKLPKCSVLTVG